MLRIMWRAKGRGNRPYALGTLRSEWHADLRVVEGDEIIPVRGSPFDMWERTSTRLPLSGVKLLLPVVPPTFYAAGLNYAEHVREAAEKIGLKVQLPTQADAGYRANNALIAHNEASSYPRTPPTRCRTKASWSR